MDASHTILLVEDENNIASFITTVFRANGYEVKRASTGAEAFRMVTACCPDVIVLDLGLPDMDGKKLIQSVREWSQTPIIVVSARAHERDKVEALDLGADDYVTKPFGTSELLARVRTAIRHLSARGEPGAGVDKPFSTQGLVVDFMKRRAFVEGEDARLTQTEFNIVALLAKYAGRVITYDAIIKSIWGPGGTGDNQILRVNMANIRRKLEKNPGEPKYIFTEMGVGYRMAESDA